MPFILDFERPIFELENKIQELRQFSAEKEIDLSEEISTLEKKAARLKEDTYRNLTPWQKVQIARHPERPSVLDYINFFVEDFVELKGDRRYGDDPAVVGGIGRFRGRPVTIIGHVKGRGTKENIARNFGMVHPEGNRKAVRLMKQAEKFRRPVICFIDTPGAYPGEGAEERGQGEAIAASLLTMATLRTPLISVVIGEGGSGGALALGMGDRVLMLEHAVYSIISPEQFANILWKEPGRAQEAAGLMKMTAQDLLAFGVIDEIVPEPLGGAHREPEQMAAILADCIEKHLREIEEMGEEERLHRRCQRFRRMGAVVEE
ncbi:MAG: acetyl-CoA carboxylase carboxyl transferase subunit alpha [Eubacteriales bacterium]|nr:acetyl-CoA carboxylase carboxyl transferase subunit alpha [Eubacteriales bacterium]MDN5363378.1 acetyl-CoA carboxylase carboxyl transferase subunit alpha [Eubacteriales bacterium]